jgi:diguanylate cyclase (GGDEF)-like protein
LAAASAGLLVLALHATAGLGEPELNQPIEHWLYDALMLGAAASCLLRAALVPTQRPAWLLIGTGVLAWALADVYWTVVISGQRPEPFPTPADAGYLLNYPLVLAGLVALVARRMSHRPPVVWIDVVLAALAITALGASFLAVVLPEQSGGNGLETAVLHAYPLLDVLTLAFVAAIVALSDWRPTRAVLMLAAGVAVTALADVWYLWASATDSYMEGGLLDVMWPLAAVLIGAAAWQPSVPVFKLRSLSSFPALLPPIVLSAGVLAILLVPVDASDFSRILSGALIVTVLVRVGATLLENSRLTAELQTDPLTGLGNRGKLLLDLRSTFESASGQPHTVAILDLDGFKLYNDTFGHPAGDALLMRLGQRFAEALEGEGLAYRMGGDEFGALVRGSSAEAMRAITAASAALADSGEGFTVTNSFGTAEIPREAGDIPAALQLADQRMYAQKDARRYSAARQAKEVLLSTLRAREPGLGEHVAGVTRLAIVVGRQLGLSPGELGSLARAAELHDIGKMAIPDAILNKPTSLTDAEWQFMRQHTILGERILRSAPSLEPVAAAVRSSHERWDGAGYPDGLAGSRIPLAARIIFVCDAFSAMVSERPYARARTPEEALAELRRCSASQFDPEIVDAFCAAWDAGALDLITSESELAEDGRSIEDHLAAWEAMSASAQR